MAARWPEIGRQPSGTPLQVWLPGPRGCAPGTRPCGSLQDRLACLCPRDHSEPAAHSFTQQTLLVPSLGQVLAGPGTGDEAEEDPAPAGSS